MKPPINSECFLGSNSAQRKRRKKKEQRNQRQKNKESGGDFFLNVYMTQLIS